MKYTALKGLKTKRLHYIIEGCDTFNRVPQRKIDIQIQSKINCGLRNGDLLPEESSALHLTLELNLLC